MSIIQPKGFECWLDPEIYLPPEPYDDHDIVEDTPRPVGEYGKDRHTFRSITTPEDHQECIIRIPELILYPPIKNLPRRNHPWFDEFHELWEMVYRASEGDPEAFKHLWYVEAKMDKEGAEYLWEAIRMERKAGPSFRWAKMFERTSNPLPWLLRGLKHEAMRLIRYREGLTKKSGAKLGWKERTAFNAGRTSSISGTDGRTHTGWAHQKAKFQKNQQAGTTLMQSKDGSYDYKVTSSDLGKEGKTKSFENSLIRQMDKERYQNAIDALGTPEAVKDFLRTVLQTEGKKTAAEAARNLGMTSEEWMNSSERKYIQRNKNKLAQALEIVGHLKDKRAREEKIKKKVKKMSQNRGRKVGVSM